MDPRRRAKEAVSKIAEKFGHLDEEELEELERVNQALRQKVERSLLAKDKIAGHAILTLAKNIYGSDARFVFELLQNADDNRFSKAHASGAPPYVTFHLYSDRIVVECNEDGFNERDLQSICSVGDSSKSASHGYIGAKGIGFKSVFIAAWKVQVQSGYYSFYFKHKRGDSGLGMVVPIWQDTMETLQDPLTRMTLYLHESDGETYLEDLRATIFKQLSDLQETSLLFLRKLKKISVKFYDDDDGLKTSRSFQKDDIDDHRVLLKTIKIQLPDDSTISTKQFHVTKYTASNLSRSASREIPDTADARKAAAVAEVVLAFPLTDGSEPLIEKQDLFAFLPVRESDFKFIIQSDFDTSANRQDISTTSRRNIDLLDAIADAFIAAVLTFCKHSDLCYTWPTFLPSSKDRITHFWLGLRDKIQSRVTRTPVLLARHGTQLRKIDTVALLAGHFKDDEGSPLLDDSATSVFISNRYSPEATNLLEEYGLKIMDVDHVVDLLRADLTRATSKMRSASTSQRWHSTMAQLLTKYANYYRVRQLALLPLRSGDWVSLDSGSVYLPTAEEIPVPIDVNMRILDPAAVANKDRRALYTRFGAAEPSVVDVRIAIGNGYGALFPCSSLAQSKSHLHFLYLSQLCDPKPVRKDYRTIHLRTSLGRNENPYTQDVFLPTHHPYGALELLASGTDVPGFPVIFLHSDYLLDAPEAPSLRYPSWERWLCDFIGVRERLRLVAEDGNALSDTWAYVASHRPDRLLGLLEHLWQHEESQITSNEALKTQIQGTNVEGLCGSLLSAPCTLKATYLPLASLRAHCERFMEQTEPFPFLELDSTMSPEQMRTKWLFLHEVFSVGIEDDLRFLLDVFFWIKQANPGSSTLTRHGRLIDLYIAIYAKCLGSADGERSRRMVANFFCDNQCVYIPPSGGNPASWTMPPTCLWDGPPNMLCKYSLRDIFTQSFGVDQANQVSGFFQYVLQVWDATWEDMIEELQSMRRNSCEDFDRVTMLYERIAAGAVGNEETQRHVRDAFAKKTLIYVVKDGTAGWYNTFDCLWSSTTDIKGKVTLNDHYEDMKDFFVDMLGVKTLTLQMVYDELLQTTSRTPIVEVKSAIWSLNALLQSEPATVDPTPLLKKKILPVASPAGTKLLVNAKIDFSIGDREYLIEQFRGRIKMLHYDLAEVRQLSTFLKWAKLSNRYLSESVKEITSVGGGDVRAVSSETRDLKRKAHALLRVAATFSSTRYTANGPGLYKTLMSIQTMATDDISSILSLSQDGKAIEVESRAGDVHIDEHDGGVTLYVPRNKRKQEFCFASPLPISLADWLMRDPTTHIQGGVDAAMVTALITLLAVAPSAVDLILDHQGIVQVPIPNEDIRSSSDDDVSDSDSEEAGDDTAVVRYTPPAEDHSPPMENGVVEVYSEQARVGYGAHGGYSASRLLPHPAHPDEDDRQYLELLNKVVRTASYAQFPSKGPFDMSSLQSVLSGDAVVGYNGYESWNRFRPNNLAERNFRVGAAGELYVFEVLSRLNPPLHGWSRDNWKSNIRDRVAIHEAYKGLGAWDGSETADLVYADTHGDLTAILIDRGYLDAVEWRSARPFYYIEVKTTTGPCGTPFYMSKGQYQRMMNIHATEGQREVYMILRVFEIECEGRIGMKLYVDPAQLKLDEELIFIGESWSVIPGTA